MIDRFSNQRFNLDREFNHVSTVRWDMVQEKTGTVHSLQERHMFIPYGNGYIVPVNGGTAYFKEGSKRPSWKVHQPHGHGFLGGRMSAIIDNQFVGCLTDSLTFIDVETGKVLNEILATDTAGTTGCFQGILGLDSEYVAIKSHQNIVLIDRRTHASSLLRMGDDDVICSNTANGETVYINNNSQKFITAHGWKSQFHLDPVYYGENRGDVHFSMVAAGKLWSLIDHQLYIQVLNDGKIQTIFALCDSGHRVTGGSIASFGNLIYIALYWKSMTGEFGSAVYMMNDEGNIVKGEALEPDPMNGLQCIVAARDGIVYPIRNASRDGATGDRKHYLGLGFYCFHAGKTEHFFIDGCSDHRRLSPVAFFADNDKVVYATAGAVFKGTLE